MARKSLKRWYVFLSVELLVTLEVSLLLRAPPGLCRSQCVMWKVHARWAGWLCTAHRAHSPCCPWKHDTHLEYDPVSFSGSLLLRIQGRELYRNMIQWKLRPTSQEELQTICLLKLSWFASPLPLRPIKQWNKNAYHTEKSSCSILRGENPLWWCYLYVEKWYLSIVRTPCTDINCFNTWAIILASSS